MRKKKKYGRIAKERQGKGRERARRVRVALLEGERDDIPTEYRLDWMLLRTIPEWSEVEDAFRAVPSLGRMCKDS